jgi:Transposase DDE domain
MSTEVITSTILRKMSELNKWQRDFFLHHVVLFLSLRGRYTYLNFGRYGQKNEATYRHHHAMGFDFRTFNRHLIEEHASPRRVIAFDPSYVSKSGKHTPGVGYFWSGCAGNAKWGLEVCGFAAVDLEANTALHYFAEQTMPVDGQGLMGFYCDLLKGKAAELLKISGYIAVDAYFSKKPFVSAAIDSGLHVITRLRDDAVLYLAPPPRKKGQKGAPRKMGDRFRPKELEGGQLPCLSRTEEERIYGGTAYVKSLGRLVAIAVVQQLREDGSVRSAKVFICTDPGFDPLYILTYYKGRFQIEFLFRDAKQHTGLEDSQSRNKEALEYHFNMSLTAVSIAKAAHYLSIEKDSRGPFSMADIKTKYFNELFVARIFEVFGKFPNINKNHPALKTIYNLGKIAA